MKGSLLTAWLSCFFVRGFLGLVVFCWKGGLVGFFGCVFNVFSRVVWFEVVFWEMLELSLLFFWRVWLGCFRLCVGYGKLRQVRGFCVGSVRW